MDAEVAELSFRAIGFHAAPNRAPIARAAGLAALAVYPARFKGGDLNVSPQIAAKILRRKVIGTGVIDLAVPRRGWKVVHYEAVDVGGDHDALLARMRHISTGKIVTFLVINCMSVSTGVLHAKSIMRAGMALDPDVIIATECRDFTARDLHGGSQYWWHQPGKPGSSESGALLGARRGVLDLDQRGRRVGSKLTPEGGWIDERSMVRARFTTKSTTTITTIK